MKKTSAHTVIALSLLFLTACGGGGSSEPSSPAAAAAAAPASASSTGAYLFESGAASYSVQLLGTLGEESYAVALNDTNQIVGNYLDHSGNLNAFLWEDGTMRALATPGQARQINNRGQIVGWMDPLGYSEAFIATGSGPIQRLNVLGGSSQALAINDQGEVAGRISDSGEKSFVASAGLQHFIANDVEGYATTINDAGQVLIRQLDADGFRTLLWDDGILTDLGGLGGKYTQGLDINAAGQVVGWAQTENGDYHAFLWQDGVMTDLASLVGNFSSAVAINGHGDILLKYSDGNGQGNLVYTNGNLIELENFGSTYAVVNDLNNNGAIAGWMQAPDGSLQAFVATLSQ